MNAWNDSGKNLSEKTQNWPISTQVIFLTSKWLMQEKKFVMKFCLNCTSFFHYYIKIISTKIKSKIKFPSIVYPCILIYMRGNYNEIYKAVLTAEVSLFWRNVDNKEVTSLKGRKLGFFSALTLVLESHLTFLSVHFLFIKGMSIILFTS